MATVNLNLSEDLQQFVNGQVETGHFEGPAEYIEALIERAQKGKNKLESLLIASRSDGGRLKVAFVRTKRNSGWTTTKFVVGVACTGISTSRS